MSEKSREICLQIYNTTQGRKRLVKLLEADKPGSCPIDSVKLSDAKEWAG